MCVACSPHPWTTGCHLADPSDDAGSPSFGVGRAKPAGTAAGIADYLLTGYWGLASPRGLAARAGDVVAVDTALLAEDARVLARAALEEWSIVTGLRFEEAAPFAPTATRFEEGDAAGDVGTTAEIAPGEAFRGAIEAGDVDHVRLQQVGARSVTYLVEGVGEAPLSAPDIVFRLGGGQAVPLRVMAGDGVAYVTATTIGDGGTYHLEIGGRNGAVGGYRLLAIEAGAPGAPDIVFDDLGAHAFAATDRSGDAIDRARIQVGKNWLLAYGTDPAGYAAQTFLHEVGHALGLGHAGAYNGRAEFGADAVFADDSWRMSVMSYFSQAENPHVEADRAHPITPMAADLAAVRRLYGEAAVRAGDTVYGEGSTAGGALDLLRAVPERPVAFTILDTGGTDRLAFGHADRDQAIDLRAGAVSSALGGRGNMVIAEGTVIEHLALGGGHDVVVGNAAANEIRAGAGDDRVEGREGDDLLEGGEGDDVLWGGAADDSPRSGDDRLHGGAGRDALHGGDGDDVLRGGEGDDDLRGGTGRDRLSGGPGDDVLAGGAGEDVFLFAGAFGRDAISDFSLEDRVEVDLAALRYGGFAHEEGDSVLSFAGAAGAFGLRLLGHLVRAADVVVDGGTLTVTAAPEPASAPPPGGASTPPAPTPARAPEGPATDAAAVASPRSAPDAAEALRGRTVSGGAGDDRLAGGELPDRLSGADGHDVLRGRGGDDLLRGGRGDDRLRGEGGDDLLRGGGGDDRLHGGRGADDLRGGAGEDRLVGGGGHDRLRGGAGDDAVRGGAGRDRLDGGGGDDVLRGGTGRDVLKGGAGRDALAGGGGADVFVFAAGFGRDVVRDFDVRRAGERIDLSGVAGFDGLGDVREAARQKGDDVRVRMGDDLLILRDVDLDDLGAGDFAF